MSNRRCSESYIPNFDNPRYQHNLNAGRLIAAEALQQLFRKEPLAEWRPKVKALQASYQPDQPQPRLCRECHCEPCRCDWPYPSKVFAYGRAQMESDLEGIEKMSHLYSGLCVKGLLNGWQMQRLETILEKMRQKVRMRVVMGGERAAGKKADRDYQVLRQSKALKVDNFGRRLHTNAK